MGLTLLHWGCECFHRYYCLWNVHIFEDWPVVWIYSQVWTDLEWEVCLFVVWVWRFPTEGVIFFTSLFVFCRIQSREILLHPQSFSHTRCDFIRCCENVELHLSTTLTFLFCIIGLGTILFLVVIIGNIFFRHVCHLLNFLALLIKGTSCSLFWLKHNINSFLTYKKNIEENNLGISCDKIWLLSFSFKKQIYYGRKYTSKNLEKCT